MVLNLKVSKNPSTIIDMGMELWKETRHGLNTSQPLVSNELDFDFKHMFNSKKSTNQTSMSSNISLREWIKHTLELADIPHPANESFTSSLGLDSNDWPADICRTLVLLSDSYLTLAL